MCLAIYKPKGVKVPSKEYLNNGFNANKDGAGYSEILPDGRIKIYKGFMTWNDFWKDFSKRGYGTKSELFIHFRYGTSGGKAPGLTHPFPITKDIETMKKTVLITNSALIHNGVLGKGEENISDTMCFIRDIVYPVIDLVGHKGVINLLARCADGSKLALYANRKVYLTGNWIITDGVYYSNKDYETPKPFIGYGIHNSDWYQDYYEGNLFETKAKEEHPAFSSGFCCPNCGELEELVCDDGCEEFTCESCGISFTIDWDGKAQDKRPELPF